MSTPAASDTVVPVRRSPFVSTTSSARAGEAKRMASRRSSDERRVRVMTVKVPNYAPEVGGLTALIG